MRSFVSARPSRWGVWGVVLALWSGADATAQFREISPDQPTIQLREAELKPTRERFVHPAAEPSEPAVPDDQPVGQPTPALTEAATPAPAMENQAATPAPSTPAATDTATATAPNNSEGGSDVAVVAPAAERIADPPPELESIDPFAAFSAHQDPAASEPGALGPDDLRPMRFNKTEPGQTTLAQVRALWGEPATSHDHHGSTTLVYQVPGFRQVDIVAEPTGQVVQTILVHLREPVEASALAEQMGLGQIAHVPVPDSFGKVLGQAYPERGVLFNYHEQSEDQTQVTAISLEPLSGELFRLRAEYDFDHQYQRSLADLNHATRIDPQDAHAHWLKAELLATVGRAVSALDSATTAVQLAPETSLYRLTKARLLADNGELQRAVRETRVILEKEDLTEIVRARAEYQLGNLLTIGPSADYQEAISHHLKAIDLAVPHASERRFAVRRMAKDILVDAHLSIALDVALGNFQKQREVVPKWLTRATELAEEFIERDQGDPTMRMQIYRTTLAAFSVLEGNFDAAVATEESLNEGRRLIAEAEDPLYQRRVERELSETLLYAVKVEHRRGRSDTALRYADNAIALLESREPSEEQSLFARLMEGQLYFLVGSLHAINRQDHAEAVTWYEKAEPRLRHEPLRRLIDLGTYGDLFVSMGVSYWETGRREEAIEVTQYGADLMQAGVQAGKVSLVSLAVPYGNLSAMHRTLGDQAKAKHFAEMTAKVEKDTQLR